MDKKKILIVSRSFYPMNSPRSFRTTELVKEFAKQGHDVTLLTFKNEELHIPFEKEYNIQIKDFGKKYFSQLDINRGNKAVHLLKRVVNRAMHLFFEFPDIELFWKVKNALKYEKGYDLLISIAVPHPIHWGVAASWKTNNKIAKKWIADCGDPYMGAALDTFKKMFYFKFFEKNFCSKADFITVPIDDAKFGYYPEYRDKIKVIPQGFNFDEAEISHYEPNPIPTFAYAGGLIPGGRDPGELLSYLTTLDKGYKFILYTKNKGLVDPYIKLGNGKIEVRDYIPRKELLKILSKMDFLINFENSTARQLPSKLIDYYLTKRPVLSIPGKDIDHEKILNFLNGDYSESLEFDDINQYRIESVCKHFLKLAE